MWELLFTRILDFIVTDLWANIDFWRIVAIVLFFIVISVYTFRRPMLSFLNREQSRSHDKDIFVCSNQIMNERQLLDFLERLGTNRYFLGESKKRNNMSTFLKK